MAPSIEICFVRGNAATQIYLQVIQRYTLIIFLCIIVINSFSADLKIGVQKHVYLSVRLITYIYIYSRLLNRNYNTLLAARNFRLIDN